MTYPPGIAANHKSTRVAIRENSIISIDSIQNTFIGSWQRKTTCSGRQKLNFQIEFCGERVGLSPFKSIYTRRKSLVAFEMASTKIIITTVPKSDQIKAFNMLPTSRKAQILQQMAAATDAKLGLQASKPSMPDSNPAPRKRQRLTHLTTEEKMMRR